METKELLELLEAVSDISWTVFEVRREDFSLRLERRKDGGAKETLTSGEVAEPSLEESPLSAEGQDLLGLKRILSPVVGLYRGLQGDRAITVGKRVKKGEPVCAIEAMKLMNEIVMPEEGEILFIMAQEGQPVEYGQLLFCYR
jgi:biotin carboxyl carrier protein